MKNYRLLTTAIVTAINASQPSSRGEVWKPEERNDVLEAEALERVGFAEVTSDEPSVITVASRRKAEIEAASAEEPQLSGVRFDAYRQSDGTFRSAQGVPVNEDGTPLTGQGSNPSALDLGNFLDGNAADVIASIKELPASERGNLARLADLEGKGKNRTTVLAAIEAAQADDGQE